MAEVAVSGHSTGVVDDGADLGGHEHALHAGCGSENLEGADHVEGGEPGVEQVGNHHVFSVWPARATHKDTLLTMSATAPAAYRQAMDSR